MGRWPFVLNKDYLYLSISIWRPEIILYHNVLGCSESNNTAISIDQNWQVLSCQPRVTVTSSFVYKVIKLLESIDHLCINPIHRIGLIQK